MADISVNGAIIAGQSFTVSFSGPLRESHGAYLAVMDESGVRVAILRGDGNPKVPMGYNLDLETVLMYDDGVSGDTSMFMFPPELPAGRYTLCTANSWPMRCVTTEVLAE